MERKSKSHGRGVGKLLAGLSPAGLDWLLFGLVALVCAGRLNGVFSDQVLPNWDAPGHLLALGRMAGYLEHGHVTGYVQQWLGGMPLFSFYGPLYFIVTAAFWLISFKLVSLALIFRISVFLSVLAIVPGLWLFARAFAGRQAARWSLVMGLLYVFYPKVYSSYGIGAGAAMWIGLVPNALGLALALVWLAALETARQRRWPRLSLIWTGLIGAALLLTHILSFLFAGVLYGFWLLAGLVRPAADGPKAAEAAIADGQDLGSTRLAGWTDLFHGLSSLAVSLLASAFWLLPFLANVSLSSGAARGAGTLKPAPFLAVFPLNQPWLNVAAAILAALAVAGLYRLCRERRWRFLAMLAGATLFLALRGLMARLVPGLGIHYYRFVPFIYAMVLVSAATTLGWLWSGWAGAAARRRAYVIFLAVALPIIYVAMFSAVGQEAPLEHLADSPVSWSRSDFAGNADAEEVVRLLGQRTDLRRAYIEMPMIEALAELGSLAYFNYRLPTDNNQALITGLYVESSPQAPFIMPVVSRLESVASSARIEEFLPPISGFTGQPLATQLERLKSFGVNYLVSYTPELATRLEAEPAAEHLTTLGHWQIFRLAEARPLVYQPACRPALLARSPGQTSFRNLSTAIFTGQDSYPCQLVQADRPLDDLASAGWLDRFSAIIIQASQMSPAEAEALRSYGRPLILLQPSEQVTRILLRGPQVAWIGRIEAIKKGQRQAVEGWPAGWSDLQREVARFGLAEGDSAATEPSATDSAPAEEAVRPAPAVTISQFDGQRISFSADYDGLAGINSSYFPRWQAADGRPVWRTTPDQMMVPVRAGETVTLFYGYTLVDRIGQAISLVTILGMAVVVGWRFKRKR